MAPFEKIEQDAPAEEAAVDETAAAEPEVLDAEAEEVAEPDAPEAAGEEAVPDRSAEYLALAQRTQADFENFRKRAARDVSAAESRGAAKVIGGLLQALDHIGIAIEHIGDQDDEAARALRGADAELHAALAKAGVEVYVPEGEPFDPTVHEAMTQAPAEGVEPGTITAVYQRGYRAGGVVLRPARVVVAA